MRRLLPVLAFSAILLSAAQAQEGNAQAGREYAQGFCAKCHGIDRAGTMSPNPKSPTFSEIANTPGMTGIALTVILQTPHREMPDFIIPPKDQANVIAYILSLKR